MSDFSLMAAPLQGYTEVAFRHFHAEIYGASTVAPVTYYSPFIRLEDGEARPRDIRGIKSELNGNHRLIPQIICRDGDEFRRLTDAVAEAGYRDVDLNIGCPFVPQVRKGRGAGLLAHPDKLTEIAGVMAANPGLDYSVKMRLGVSKADEWKEVLPIINAMDLSHVTIHPRTASQQYGGALHIDEFAMLTDGLRHPVVFNGDITSPEMIDSLRDRFPGLKGVMVGRGLLMRPSLFAEWAENREWSREERIGLLLELHDRIFSYCCDILSGDTQILMKIKPMWEYFGVEFDRKSVKRIMKSTKITAYAEAVNRLVVP